MIIQDKRPTVQHFDRLRGKTRRKIPDPTTLSRVSLHVSNEIMICSERQRKETQNEDRAPEFVLKGFRRNNNHYLPIQTFSISKSFAAILNRDLRSRADKFHGDRVFLQSLENRRIPVLVRGVIISGC